MFLVESENIFLNITGHAINISILGAAIVTTTAMIFYNTWENRKRDRSRRDHRSNEEDESTLGYRHPSLRHTVYIGISCIRT